MWLWPSSMQAMIRPTPPQSEQVSMSMLNTQYRRCDGVIGARRLAGVGSTGSAVIQCRPPLLRLARVTRPRYWLLGANTPWKGVRLTWGLGTKVTSRAMKAPPDRRDTSHSWRDAVPLPSAGPPSLAGRSPRCEVTLGHFGLSSPIAVRGPRPEGQKGLIAN